MYITEEKRHEELNLCYYGALSLEYVNKL